MGSHVRCPLPQLVIGYGSPLRFPVDLHATTPPLKATTRSSEAPASSAEDKKNPKRGKGTFVCLSDNWGAVRLSCRLDRNHQRTKLNSITFTVMSATAVKKSAPKKELIQRARDAMAQSHARNAAWAAGRSAEEVTAYVVDAICEDRKERKNER